MLLCLKKKKVKKSMMFGNLKKIPIYLICSFFFFSSLLSDDSIQVTPIINLEQLPATFEEDKEVLDQIEKSSTLIIKKKKENTLIKKSDDKIYVNLKALDKITAKTSSIKIAIGEKKNFGKLEIKPLKCGLLDMQETTDTVAYIQVKDMSAKDNNRVFIFNGWTFASSPTLRSIDHPIYDLWLIGCENV
jgi:hypothetical protein